MGIVWHDEGPWVHNARNRVLWGTWRTDEWNPVFLTPVFTGLEYLSFQTFGVGTAPYGVARSRCRAVSGSAPR